jgi:hypothetical protein
VKATVEVFRTHHGFCFPERAVRHAGLETTWSKIFAPGIAI